MNKLTHLSLFSGIGGLDIAAEWAGFRTVGQCEWADYPTKVLEKHWPDVPRWRDIQTLTGESFYERTGLRTVDVISGGFPCQPFSTAGKRRGEEDDRYLWPEMVRVIAELRPTWVIGENVAGIVTMALDTVLSDLEGQGYATRTFLIPAAGVGAPHMRYRTAIVAWNAHGGNRDKRAEREMEEGENRESARICTDVADTKSEYARGLSFGKGAEIARPVICGKNVQYTDCTGCEKLYAASFADDKGLACGGRNERDVCNTSGKRFQDRPSQQMEGQGTQEMEPKRPDSNVSNTNNREPVRRETCTGENPEAAKRKENNRRGMPEYAGWEWWAVEPSVGRVANGVPNRVDRLKCLGNAVVPQQFYPVFQGIAEIEKHVN